MSAVNVKPEDIEESTAKMAKPEGLALSTAGVSIGSTIEVLWEVELEDGDTESVWWAAKVGVDDSSEEPGAARIDYVPQHGFEAETRRVILMADNWLWDAVNKDKLPYRKEGEPSPPSAAELEVKEEAEADGEEEGDDEEELPLGAAVKARFQGGEIYHAGTIMAVHADSEGGATYDVLYEDNVMEQNVPRDVIEVVDLTPAARQALEERENGGEVQANSINEFFEMFVTGLTSGPAFSRLTPEQQAVASEKVRAMRPHFEAELDEFKERRGWGALVTGADIKELLPRVMARVAAAGRA